MKSEVPPKSWMMEPCNLFGRVGMVILWYWDGSDDSQDVFTALRGIELLPDLLQGRTGHFSADEWFTYFDALGNYPHRDEEMAELYAIAELGTNGRLPPGPTKKFMVVDDEFGIMSVEEWEQAEREQKDDDAKLNGYHPD